jgi:hypothetical protein
VLISHCGTAEAGGLRNIENVYRVEKWFANALSQFFMEFHTSAVTPRHLALIQTRSGIDYV